MAKAQEFAFEIVSRHQGARLGRLELGQTVLTTPTCLLHCKGGAIQHQQPDLVARLAPCLVHTSLSQVHPKPGVERLKKLGMTYDKMIHTENPILLSCTEPYRSRPDAFNTATAISVWNYSGRSQVTVKQYAALVDAIKPAAVVAMADIQTSSASLKRQRKSALRTATFTKQLLATLKASNTEVKVLGSIVGGSHKQAMTESLELMVPLADQLLGKPTCSFMFEVIQSRCVGYSVESLGSGESPSQRLAMLEQCSVAIPENKLKLASGISDPAAIVQAVKLGYDVFDGQLAIQAAEDGEAFWFEDDLSMSRVSLWNSEEKEAMVPVTSTCDCYTCTNFTKAYLFHLLVTHEMLATVLLTHHNVHQLQGFFEMIKSCIAEGRDLPL
eukprot:m.50273 g.50273  ORF g.50273 m.50273 type:complete len:385 (+) comp13409_c0_seq2:240-1394(+)